MSGKGAGASDPDRFAPSGAFAGAGGRTPSGRTLILLGLLVLAMGGMAWGAAAPETRGAFVASALAAGALCVLVWKRGDVSMPVVIGLALAFRLAVCWLPPTLSDDAYRYVWDGLVQAEGHNPYLHAPDSPDLEALRDEPLYEELNSESLYTVYPPVSQLVFRIGAVFYDRGWSVSWFVIKGILALLEFGAVLVLARMLSPRQLLLYAWNPAVALVGAGQGHSEAAMALFLALALYALRKDQGVRASVWLACAGGVKLYPFLLLPFLWRRFGWKSVAASLGMALLPALPFLHIGITDIMQNMGSSLHLYVRLFEFNAGLYYCLKYFLMLLTGLDVGKLLGPMLAAAYLGVLGVLYAGYARRRKPTGTGWKAWGNSHAKKHDTRGAIPTLPAGAGWKAWADSHGMLREDGPLRPLFVWAAGGFLVCATTVHPWYLLGVLVLAAPAERPAWHWWGLSLCSLGTYWLYTGGPYWLWVWMGWGGWTALAAWRYRGPLTDLLLRARAARKAARVARFLAGSRSVLDVGAAEGYVGANVAKRLGVNEGKRLGANAAKRLGANVGKRLGANAAKRLGANEAKHLGANEAKRLGANEGKHLGANAGKHLGANEGKRLGANVAKRLGAGRAVAVPFLAGSRSVLDAGAAEGYVGANVEKRLGVNEAKRLGAGRAVAVRLVDIQDRNRTSLPLDVYDGRRLPYASDAFDAALLIFVLHHTDPPEALLRETLRVGRRIAILESTYVWGWERTLLGLLDRLANRLRTEGSGTGLEGSMSGSKGPAPKSEGSTPKLEGSAPRLEGSASRLQGGVPSLEGPLGFRTHEAWLDCFREMGLRVVHSAQSRRCVDRQSLFVVEWGDGVAGGVSPSKDAPR